MRKVLIRVVIIFLLVGGYLYYRYNYTGFHRISKVLNINLKHATVCKAEDTHGGFVHDGYEFYEVLISKEREADLIKEISEADGWNAFPLPENIEDLIYGEVLQNVDENVTQSGISAGSVINVSSWVKTDDDVVLFPRIKEGYYFFCDNQKEKRHYRMDEDFWERGSHNFTVAIYDIENRKLYFYELDT